MKMIKEFTKEQLMAMPLIALRGIDVETPAQEMMIQQVVSEKLNALPPQRPIFRKDVPDIKTPEQEMHWQEIIDRRTRLARGESLESIGSVSAPEPIGEPEPEPVPEVGPEGQPLAEPVGEGEPVSFTQGVTSNLTPVKIDKRSKAYRDSLKKVEPSEISK
jgi:hypothetical protein